MVLAVVTKAGSRVSVLLPILSIRQVRRDKQHMLCEQHTMVRVREQVREWVVMGWMLECKWVCASDRVSGWVDKQPQYWGVVKQIRGVPSDSLRGGSVLATIRGLSKLILKPAFQPSRLRAPNYMITLTLFLSPTLQVSSTYRCLQRWV